MSAPTSAEPPGGSISEAEVERHLAYIRAALDTTDDAARDQIIGEALVAFGPRFVTSVSELHAMAEEGTDELLSGLLQAVLDRLGAWLGGTWLTDRVDEDDRRAIAAHQLLDRAQDLGLARLVARVIAELPDGHPLRDVGRARQLLDGYLARPETQADPESTLMAIGDLIQGLSDADEVAALEARAAPLLDEVDPETAVGFHISVVGRASQEALACENAGDVQGQYAWIDRMRPHAEALRRTGGPRALAIAALNYEVADQSAEAADLYDEARHHPEVDPGLARVAALGAGRCRYATGQAAAAVEALQPLLPDLMTEYGDAISAQDVQDAGHTLHRACQHLMLALAELGRWPDVVQTLDLQKSMRFRSRQALRETAAGRELLAMEQTILDAARGVPVDLPDDAPDPADFLRSDVPTLSTLQEAYRSDRPAVAPTAVSSPAVAQIAEVLAPDEVAVLLGMATDGTLIIVIGPESDDQPRHAELDRSLPAEDWLQVLAGQSEDGWLYALGAPEAAIDQRRALRDLIADVDARFGQRLAALIGELPARVTIIPHRLLHLVPYHALHSLDPAVVTTAPSAAQLVRDRRRPVPALQGRAVVVADPNSNLPLSPAEAAAVQTAGLPVHVLSGPAATEEAVVSAVRGATLLHVSGHGTSDLGQPDDSALLLAAPPPIGPDPFPAWLAAAQPWTEVDEETRRAVVPGVGALRERRLLDGAWVELTMHLAGRQTIWSFERDGRRLALAERWSAGDILVDDALDGCALAVLSACESAAGAMSATIDEFSGLPAALAMAGAGTVVASQWPVDEGVAALTVDLLYTELAAHPAGAVDLSEVLSRVRARLRTLNRDEAVALAQGLRQRTEQPRARFLLEALARRLAKGDEQPFADPWDWAAFVVAGQGRLRKEAGA